MNDVDYGLLREQVGRVLSEQRTLKIEISGVRASMEALHGKFDGLQLEINALRANLRAAAARIEHFDTLLDRNTDRLDAMHGDLGDIKSALSEIKQLVRSGGKDG